MQMFIVALFIKNTPNRKQPKCHLMGMDNKLRYISTVEWYVTRKSNKQLILTDESQKYHGKLKKLDTKARCYLIPFLWNLWKLKITESSGIYVRVKDQLQSSKMGIFENDGNVWSLDFESYAMRYTCQNSNCTF